MVLQREVGSSNAQPNEGESGGETLSSAGDVARNNSGPGDVGGGVTSESRSCREGSWESGTGGAACLGGRTTSLSGGRTSSLSGGSRATAGTDPSGARGGCGARKGGGNINTVCPAESGSGSEAPCYGFTIGKLFRKRVIVISKLTLLVGALAVPPDASNRTSNE